MLSVRGLQAVESEVAVCRFLADRGAAAAAPSSTPPPGPFTRGQIVVSFWQEVQLVDSVLTPRRLGRSLKDLHSHLQEYDGPLPSFANWLWDELRYLALNLPGGVGPQCQRAIDVLQTWLGSSFPCQPVHGDSHLYNVLQTGNGPLWCDFEAVFAAPIEWDLACIVAMRSPGTRASRVVRGVRGVRGVIRAYGEHDENLLKKLVMVRILFVALFTYHLALLRGTARDRLYAEWRVNNFLHDFGRLSLDPP
jgi:Ser/Thr protein kinase RdoA (MazF antagonist)